MESYVWFLLTAIFAVLFYKLISNWKFFCFIAIQSFLPVIKYFHLRIKSQARQAIFKDYLAIFPWFKEIEDNWKTYQEEAQAFLEKGHQLHNVTTSGGDTELNPHNKWKLGPILVYGEVIGDASQHFPATLRVLSRHPQIQTAVFSLLKAGGHIPPHEGSTSSILRYHLGLVIPKSQPAPKFRVDGQCVHWEEGKRFLFDDTFLHDAKNDNKEDRIVLIIDVPRPNLSPIEMYLRDLEIWKRRLDFKLTK